MVGNLRETLLHRLTVEWAWRRVSQTRAALVRFI